MANEEMRKIFSNNLRYWLGVRDKTQADLSRYMNVSSATASDWCHGRKLPRTDKIQSICNWLGLELSDLLTEKDYDEKNDEYLFDDDARDLAQFLFDNPEYKSAFDAVRKIKKEDIRFIKEFVERVAGNN